MPRSRGSHTERHLDLGSADWPTWTAVPEQAGLLSASVSAWLLLYLLLAGGGMCR